MRSAECGMEGRTSIPHSAFRIPHWGGVVRLDEFRSLVARLQSEIPSEFTGGGGAGGGRPQAPPPPGGGGGFTPGGGGPPGGGGSGAGLHSPVLLYPGSFASPPPLGGLDRREGNLGTLTPRPRH